MRCWNLLIAFLLGMKCGTEGVIQQDDEILDRYVEMAHAAKVLQDLNSTIGHYATSSNKQKTPITQVETAENAIQATQTGMYQHQELQQLSSTLESSHIKFDSKPLTSRQEPNWETNSNRYTIPGIPGRDYPTHTYIPLTQFYCYNQRHPGYYADQETNCQVFHVCDMDGRQDSFLCPLGTIFNQPLFVCDWWFNVDCQKASKFYDQNTLLYKSLKPKIPQHLPSAGRQTTSFRAGNH